MFTIRFREFVRLGCDFASRLVGWPLLWALLFVVIVAGVRRRDARRVVWLVLSRLLALVGELDPFGDER